MEMEINQIPDFEVIPNIIAQNSSQCNTNSILKNSSTNNSRELEVGDIFYGSFKHRNTNNKHTKTQGIFKVKGCIIKGKNKQSKEFTLVDIRGEEYKVCSGAIQIATITKEQKMKQVEKKAQEAFSDNNQSNQDKDQNNQQVRQIQYELKDLEPSTKLLNLVKAGIKNIWMVGPAGCGKSTIARNVAKELEIPYLCISCGIGTSATEFTGYKYPTREATKFSEFYAKKSVILIDEMTALDPAVAQVINAALANDEIETTTGTVTRHPDCIIIATSNTFGNGANRQYVANNQLDASTIDRFIGGIIEVDYSEEYESKYDSEVVKYVQKLRKCIAINSLRRVASTRMIQAGEKMKKAGIADWKDLLVVNWTETEQDILTNFLTNESSSRKYSKKVS